MTIPNSGDSSRWRRLEKIDPIESDRKDDEDNGQRKKQRVLYHGRSWGESEQDLPMKPAIPKVDPKDDKKPPSGLYANQSLLEKAEKILARFVSLEEKIAQMCFFETEAFYDLEQQKQLEEYLQRELLGGILFSQGDYRRQSYLIECYCSKTRIPLLVGNDFLQGLSFYFQGEIPFEALATMNETRFSDLGKAVVFQNKQLGINFQFDRERRGNPRLALQENQIKAFRNGIRLAHGIVGREKRRDERESYSMPFQKQVKNDKVQEAYILKTLSFLDFSGTPKEGFEEKLLHAFSSPYDAFLLSSHLGELIDITKRLVKSGQIKEKELDKRVIKVLLLKIILFNIN